MAKINDLPLLSNPTEDMYCLVGKENLQKVPWSAIMGQIGAPYIATTVAGMTDKTRVYVYQGSESGYTSGNWYYWNGSAWTSGGIYNSAAVNTDKTLTQSDKAADSAIVGKEIGSLKESLEIEKKHTETEYKEEVVQLEITEGQAISTDGELYSSAYARWGKASVEGLCKIKVSGRSQQNKKYPLISYFDTNDKLLGSDCGDGTAKNYVDIELTTPLRTAYVKINGAQGTSTSVGPKLTKVSQLTVKEFLNKNKNNDNPLYGKK